MSPTLDAFCAPGRSTPGSWPRCWSLPAIYLRGWLVLHRRDPQRWRGGRLAAFLGGLAAIYLALASPIEPFAVAAAASPHGAAPAADDGRRRRCSGWAHPLFPLLRGLPRPVRIYWVAPAVRSRRLRRIFRDA